MNTSPEVPYLVRYRLLPMDPWSRLNVVAQDMKAALRKGKHAVLFSGRDVDGLSWLVELAVLCCCNYTRCRGHDVAHQCRRVATCRVAIHSHGASGSPLPHCGECASSVLRDPVDAVRMPLELSTG